MKKMFFVLAAFICLCGCSASEPTPQTYTLIDDVTLPEIMEEFATIYQVEQAASLTTDMAMQLLGLKSDEITEVAGCISLAQDKASQMIAIKASADKVAQVTDRLEERQNLVFHTYDGFVQEQAELAQQGRVIVVGEYVFLFIVDTDDDGMDTLQETLTAYFK